ncbi:hypothetical protein LSCM1_06183 [Leishmania martiniquensis]|uniref:Uncharacterized protein n=1 Tax=Leishmania martiniquensis TaxID=1580590 RepID=A0A836GTJ0_9TRYP|nr:hypothetical protein LSCM1_06183 [Leishmania martiniquensis]
MSDGTARQLAIAASWVHADLQKLRRRLERVAVARQLKALEEHWRHVETQLGAVERSTSHQRFRIEQLTKELENLRAELEPNLTLLEEGQRIVHGVRNQLHYQKSISRSHTSYSGELTGLSTVKGVGAVDLHISVACPLSVHGLSLFPSCVAHAAPPRATDVRAFLQRCASLFQWSEEEQAVKPPFFFDEPCLMECDTNGTLSDPEERVALSAAVCRNAACPYWHRDQLTHVKMAVAVLLDFIRCHSVLDEHLCAVTRLTASLARHVHHADSISLVCALVCEALQRLIVTGLHAWLLSGKQSTLSMMSAPVLKTIDAQRSAPSRAALLRNTEERECWNAVEQQQQNLFPSTDSFSLTTAAAAQFQSHPSSLSWRCMLAAVEDVALRRWLGRQGVELFPRSPELHMQYVLAVVSSGGGNSEVLESCLAACRTLSAQAAASVVAGLDCGQYASSVARHVAYLLARVFAHVAETDAAAALAFLAPLLSADTEAGVATLLLPLARQNLALLMVALRRTGHMRYAKFLPLAAISDIALELPPSDGTNPPESGREALYAALRLVASYKRDRFDAQLVSTCDSALQLSILRTFSHRLAYAERVVEKTVPESPLAQGVLYSEYVDAVAQQQSVHAAASVADALAHNEGSSCTLIFLLQRRLRAWGSPLSQDAQDAVLAFCAENDLTPEELGDPSRLRDIFQLPFSRSPPVEWVSAYALQVMCTSGDETAAESMWAKMDALPVELLMHDAVAATFFFHLLLQLSGEACSATLFYRTVRRCLSLFGEVHHLTWSALEGSAGNMIGLPHYLSLCIYQEVPLLLGPGAGATFAWRCLVLEAAASLGVLHPLLVTD